MKKFLTYNWKTIIWLTLAGFVMTLIWIQPWRDPLEYYLRLGLFIALIWNLMWLGNNYISDYLSTKISWTERPALRFFIGIVVMIVYTLIATFGLIFLYDLFSGTTLMRDAYDFAWWSLVITGVVSLFMHGRAFLANWRAAELKSARLESESMKAQFDSLKSQVNPHFLFNSLNALTNLIYEDPDKAARFVKQLSEVYRYVLDTQDKELVLLADEIRFLRSYLFLQQIRYGDKLVIDMQTDPSDVQIPPLTLQMLVENSIKHNVISKDQPLTIRIFNDKKQIVVANNIQKKNVLPEDSKGIGLENIRKRYSFLSNDKVEVSNDQSSFIVKLPAL